MKPQPGDQIVENPAYRVAIYEWSAFDVKGNVIRIPYPMRGNKLTNGEIAPEDSIPPFIVVRSKKRKKP